jgi:small subunit ribosomal protein S7
LRSNAEPTKSPEKNIEQRTEQEHNLHVSEEASVIAKARGEKGPDLQQGTPVEDIVKGDKNAQDSLPKVMKDALKADKSSGSRSFSTMATRRPPTSRFMSTSAPRQVSAMSMMTSSSGGGMEAAIIESGMSDLAPKEPRTRVRHLHNRYQNIVEQLVGLLIRDGKKAAAQRVRHAPSSLSHTTSTHQNRTVY